MKDNPLSLMIIPDIHFSRSYKSGLSIQMLQRMIREGHKILFIDYEGGLDDFKVSVGTPGHIDHDAPIEELVARLPELPEEELRDTDRDPYYLKYTKRRKKR